MFGLRLLHVQWVAMTDACTITEITWSTESQIQKQWPSTEKASWCLVCITGTVKFTDKVDTKPCSVEVKCLAHSTPSKQSPVCTRLMLIKLPSMDIIIPILQMRKLRLREVKWLSQCHSTKKKIWHWQWKEPKLLRERADSKCGIIKYKGGWSTLYRNQRRYQGLQRICQDSEANLIKHSLDQDGTTEHQ